MKVLVRDILEKLNAIAPFSLAENWDNVGLLIGDPAREVKSLLLGLDPTLSLLSEALETGADTIVTHHPIIFRPLNNINVTSPEGIFIERALANKINVIACHTNLDLAENGVSDVLCRGIGLEKVRPLQVSQIAQPERTGLGRIGYYSVPLDFSEFKKRLFQTVATQHLQLAGILPTEIKCVAICGGSGSELAAEAHRQKADIYISSEIKHSTAVWAKDSGFCVVDAGHYGTEKPVIQFLAQKLNRAIQDKRWSVVVIESKTEKMPFAYIQNNS